MQDNGWDWVDTPSEHENSGSIDDDVNNDAINNENDVEDYSIIHNQSDKSDNCIAENQNSVHTPLSSPLRSLQTTSQSPSLLQNESNAIVLAHNDSNFDVNNNASSNTNFSLPNTLQKLETQTLRRQQALHSHLHQLSCDVGRLTAQLAETTLERHSQISQHKQFWEKQLRNTYKEHQSTALQSTELQTKMMITDTVDTADNENTVTVTNNDDNSSETSNLLLMPAAPSSTTFQSLSTLLRVLSRIDALETTLIDTVHRRFDRLQRKRFDVDQIRQLARQVNVQTLQADKRQAGLWRRWESMAGSQWALHWHEERAQRHANMVLLQQDFDKLYSVKQEEGQDILAQVQKLRQKVAQERAARQRQDAKIRQSIEESAAKLQEAFLEIYGN